MVRTDAGEVGDGGVSVIYASSLDIKLLEISVDILMTRRGTVKSLMRRADVRMRT